MDQQDLNLDLLLQETLALTEYLRVGNFPGSNKSIQTSFLNEANEIDDTDYLFDVADSLLDDSPEEPSGNEFSLEVNQLEENVIEKDLFPESSGVIYRIDSGPSTFCVRGFSSHNLSKSMRELKESVSSKRPILKITTEDDFKQICYFETRTFELAEAIREQIVNRRFPHQEDALCNLSDPGFSWWMDVQSHSDEDGRFEIFFRSHGINRAEKYLQLGPIGDGSIAALRMNQARTLLRSSFPISEFSCDDKSFAVASLKPDHSSFVSFKNIFLYGLNNTTLENFPDNSLGRTLYFYFHELAIVRKFWIEVKKKLG
jgi:hypothetical protein